MVRSAEIPGFVKNIVNSRVSRGFLFPLAILGGAGIAASPTAANPDCTNLSPVYRLTSSSHPDHVYTLSAAEKNNAQSQFGYIYEGVAFKWYETPGTDRIPVHRLQNGITHLTTSSEEEKNNAQSQFGFRYEGIVAYAPQTNTDGAADLYRLHLNGGDYFYTMNVAERDNAVSVYGYTYEGVAGLVYPNELNCPSPTSTPTPENCPESIAGKFYRVRACFTDSFGTRRLFGAGLAGDGTANDAVYNWDRDRNTLTNRIPINAALNPDSDGIAIAGIVVDTTLGNTYLLEGADKPIFTNIIMARLEYFNTTQAITNPTNLSSHSAANNGLPQGGINGVPDGFTLTEKTDSNGKYLEANVVNSVNSAENGRYNSRLASNGTPGVWSQVSSTSTSSAEARMTVTPTRTPTPRPTVTIRVTPTAN